MVKRQLSNVVWLRLLYDAFDPETVETHELKWRRGATVADYLDGLPGEAEWMIFVNGREIDIVTEGETVLEREDQIGLILVPQGGNGGMKSVLRIVMQAAAVALAFTGIGFVAALAINVGIGLVNAFLLTPKPPKKDSGDTSNSYGIDGAKNSATEGIPYPVGFGEFRFAGNYSDCYTVNVGDVQYLYIRSILNDGLIDSVNDIEINEQPIANFTDVETRIALGSLDQGVNDWFQNAIVQVNKSQKLDTVWNTHITSGEVDKIRWDIVFTNGLVNIDEKKGTYKNRSVTFAMEVQQIDPRTKQAIGPWQSASNGPSTYNPDLNGDGILTLQEIMLARLVAKSPQLAAQTAGSSTARAVSSTPGIMYRQKGTTDWAVFGEIDGSGDSYAYDASGDGSIVGDTDITPQANAVFEKNLAPGTYEFMPVNGATIEQAQAWPSSQSLTQTVTDKRTRQIRHSFETGQLTKGYYQARIRRTSATSTDQYQVDEVYLSDVAEIQLDQVAQVGTASLSLKIKLTEQLNGIPQVTSRVRFSLCQTYDAEGNPLGEKWTANPAWHGLDLLCGAQRGVGVKPKRIDWPRWIEFADYCELNKLFFNGVFAEGSNAGDVLNSILRIGHAAPIPFGTRISVAIDRERDPVAYFGPANIIKDSFEISYLGVADRANEYEVTYYDREDRNKAKTIRYVDPKAVRFNEIARLAQVSFPGIDNIDQARTELWRMIYANRLLMRTITFDSFLDSINMPLGEVALIQHDQMAWATGGKLKDGSTVNRLALDKPVTIEGTKDYSAIAYMDAVNLGTRAVNSVVGRKVLVTGDAITSLRAKRMIVGADDYEIVSLQDGNPYHTITLDSAPGKLASGTTVELWDTDVIVERRVDKGPGRTNWMRNNTFVGAKAGTLPAGITTKGGAGLTYTMVGAGVDADGHEYIDVRCAGTNQGSGQTWPGLNLNVGAPVVATAGSEDWTISCYTTLLAGTANASRALYLSEKDAAGAGLGNSTQKASSPSLAPASTNVKSRAYRTYTMRSNAAQIATAWLDFGSLAVGQTIDVTYRITRPQLERGAVPTASIPTPGNSATVWDDVTLDTVQLTQPLPAAPGALSSYIFGEVKNVRKPFTLTGISGNGIEKRKLTFMEYHAGVYGPSEVEIPVPVVQITDRDVQHVSGLLFDYERMVAADRKTIAARVHWSAAGIRNYAGADVYMSVNGEAFRAAGNAANMTELPVTLNEGDTVEFKVVAYNGRGDRAPMRTAPSVSGTIAVVYAEVDAPSSISVAVVNFQVDGRAQISLVPPADATGITGYEVQYRKKADLTWTSAGTINGTVTSISGLETATYIAQVRSVSDSGASGWISKEFTVAVAPGSLMANFLSSNDRNKTPIPAPVTKVDVDVDHVINTDGSADVSFEWEWSGDEATIDGFEVTMEVEAV